MTAVDKVMENDITAVPLTPAEETRLVHLEQVVETGLTTFVEVGRALAAIRDGRLYRATHSTFVAYVKDRFGLSESHAYRKMDAAEVAAIVSPIGEVANEAQARELVGLEPEQQIEVYQRAIAETAGRPTAGAVRDARREIAPKPLAAKPRRIPLPEQYRRLIWELDKLTRKLGELHRDDRFGHYRDDRLPHGLLIEIAGRVAAMASDFGGQPTLHGAEAPDTDIVSAETTTPWSVELVVTKNSVRVEPSGSVGLAEHAVKEVLDRLGVKSMRDRFGSRRLLFPVNALHDVEAALEVDGRAVTIWEAP